ncbi:MAG: hypothetical protein F4112_10160 [Holophagales bacterium]|nr:hypothetical protein [Holophagales bacterium]MYD23843.1 hypothetical protein [Holophagales bacterium]MYI33324.1 hypothetical protein [Holophagales bacterium]
MTDADLTKRWVGDDGELLEWPKNLGIDGLDDIVSGLIHYAQVFRPPAPKIKVVYKQLDGELDVQWKWRWSPRSFVDAHAYRYKFEGSEWAHGGWQHYRQLGYSPGSLDDPKHEDQPYPAAGFSIEAPDDGGVLTVEVALIGFAGLSRGPIASERIPVPRREDILADRRHGFVIYDVR